MVLTAPAQELLTLEQAMVTALENNYSIRLEKYNVEVNENNVSRAVSGQRPLVEFSGSFEYGYAESETQTLNLGPEGGASDPIDLDGTSQELLLRNQVSVPIFDGFRGKYRFKQLENAHRMSELQLAGVVEQTIAQTVSAYLQIARLQTRLRILEDNLAISDDRAERVRVDASFGASNSVRALQAEVDFKTDSANFRTTLLDYENSRRDLNLLMAVSPDQEYLVEEQVVLSSTLDYDQLRNDMKANNKQLLLSQRSVDHAVYEARISQGTYYPTVRGYANMTYFDSEDEANFLQSNSVFGPNAGVTVSFPFLTGGGNRIKRQNAQIGLYQQRTALESTELTLEKEFQNSFAQYRNSQEQLRIERSNLATFELNYERTQEDYKRGQVDGTDLRLAQLNLSSARNRINDLSFQVKQAEVALLRLSGNLGQP